jgi:hypothetical protein
MCPISFISSTMNSTHPVSDVLEVLHEDTVVISIGLPVFRKPFHSDQIRLRRMGSPHRKDSGLRYIHPGMHVMPFNVSRLFLCTIKFS